MSKESDLYDPYNTKTIGGNLRLDVDSYEEIQDNIHLERPNRNLLELTDLIGRVTNNRSASGPIPGTGEIAAATVTISSVDVDLKAPNAGEVWQVMGVSAEAAGTLSTLSGITLYLKLDTVSGHPGSSNSAYVLEWAGSGSIEPADTSYGSVLHIDQNLVLKARVFKSGGRGSGEEVKFKVPIIRVR